ncbi:hypothetical protein [Zhihengliuella halotolerans]|uniref:hypothetical protein n=1 Tax=Zhihengliuella halotolerans TaxID=370736 RepID=UPI000C7FB4B6|nr:hypothetical protein [Zhihengliuella halotolerans]
MTAYQYATAGICMDTGKLKYVSRKEAKRVVRLKGWRDMSVYACPDCSHIHIGGWHGVKDRIAHRELHGTDRVEPEPQVPIEDAAAELGVSTDAIRRAIAVGAARGTDTHIHHGDLARLRECTWRTP